MKNSEYFEIALIKRLRRESATELMVAIEDAISSKITSPEMIQALIYVSERTYVCGHHKRAAVEYILSLSPELLDVEPKKRKFNPFYWVGLLFTKRKETIKNDQKTTNTNNA